MTPLFTKPPNSTPADHFRKQLKNLSKPSFLAGHLMVKRDGTLVNTNLLAATWHKLVSLFGLNLMQNRLIEFKMIQLVLTNRQWVNSQEDIELIKALAKRVGLTSNSKQDHFELQLLIDQIAKNLFKSGNQPLKTKYLIRLQERFLDYYKRHLKQYPPGILLINKIFDENLPNILPSQHDKKGSSESESQQADQENPQPDHETVPLIPTPETSLLPPADTTQTNKNPLLETPVPKIRDVAFLSTAKKLALVAAGLGTLAIGLQTQLGKVPDKTRVIPLAPRQQEQRKQDPITILEKEQGFEEEPIPPPPNRKSLVTATDEKLVIAPKTPLIDNTTLKDPLEDFERILKGNHSSQNVFNTSKQVPTANNTSLGLINDEFRLPDYAFAKTLDGGAYSVNTIAIATFAAICIGGIAYLYKRSKPINKESSNPTKENGVVVSTTSSTSLTTSTKTLQGLVNTLSLFLSTTTPPEVLAGVTSNFEWLQTLFFSSQISLGQIRKTLSGLLIGLEDPKPPQSSLHLGPSTAHLATTESQKPAPTLHGSSQGLAGTGTSKSNNGTGTSKSNNYSSIITKLPYPPIKSLHVELPAPPPTVLPKQIPKAPDTPDTPETRRKGPPSSMTKKTTAPSSSPIVKGPERPPLTGSHPPRPLSKEIGDPETSIPRPVICYTLDDLLIAAAGGSEDALKKVTRLATSTEDDKDKKALKGLEELVKSGTSGALERFLSLFEPKEQLMRLTTFFAENIQAAKDELNTRIAADEKVISSIKNLASQVKAHSVEVLAEIAKTNHSALLALTDLAFSGDAHAQDILAEKITGMQLEPAKTEDIEENNTKAFQDHIKAFFERMLSTSEKEQSNVNKTLEKILEKNPTMISFIIQLVDENVKNAFNFLKSLVESELKNPDQKRNKPALQHLFIMAQRESPDALNALLEFAKDYPVVETELSELTKTSIAILKARIAAVKTEEAIPKIVIPLALDQEADIYKELIKLVEADSKILEAFKSSFFKKEPNLIKALANLALINTQALNILVELAVQDHPDVQCELLINIEAKLINIKTNRKSEESEESEKFVQNTLRLLLPYILNARIMPQKTLLTNSLIPTTSNIPPPSALIPRPSVANDSDNAWIMLQKILLSNPTTILLIKKMAENDLQWLNILEKLAYSQNKDAIPPIAELANDKDPALKLLSKLAESVPSALLAFVEVLNHRKTPPKDILEQLIPLFPGDKEGVLTQLTGLIKNDSTFISLLITLARQEIPNSLEILAHLATTNEGILAEFIGLALDKQINLTTDGNVFKILEEAAKINAAILTLFISLAAAGNTSMQDSLAKQVKKEAEEEYRHNSKLDSLSSRILKQLTPFYSQFDYQSSILSTLNKLIIPNPHLLDDLKELVKSNHEGALPLLVKLAENETELAEDDAKIAENDKKSALTFLVDLAKDNQDADRELMKLVKKENKSALQTLLKLTYSGSSKKGINAKLGFLIDLTGEGIRCALDELNHLLGDQGHLNCIQEMAVKGNLRDLAVLESLAEKNKWAERAIITLAMSGNKNAQQSLATQMAGAEAEAIKETLNVLIVEILKENGDAGAFETLIAIANKQTQVISVIGKLLEEDYAPSTTEQNSKWLNLLIKLTEIDETQPKIAEASYHELVRLALNSSLKLKNLVIEKLTKELSIERLIEDAKTFVNTSDHTKQEHKLRALAVLICKESPEAKEALKAQITQEGVLEMLLKKSSLNAEAAIIIDQLGQLCKSDEELQADVVQRLIPLTKNTTPQAAEPSQPAIESASKPSIKFLIDYFSGSSDALKQIMKIALSLDNYTIDYIKKVADKHLKILEFVELASVSNIEWAKNYIESAKEKNGLQIAEQAQGQASPTVQSPLIPRLLSVASPLVLRKKKTIEELAKAIRKMKQDQQQPRK